MDPDLRSISIVNKLLPDRQAELREPCSDVANLLATNPSGISLGTLEDASCSDRAKSGLRKKLWRSGQRLGPHMDRGVAWRVAHTCDNSSSLI